ncbi:uncharacterized protein LOC779912 [Xenopus tropicalis]|uniref:Uncharacterized protein LOC779912 n=1 Tax=Xenopus tropicalis TaxID=8364 RepID=Q0P4X8_XENTR|nr:uncharacterized protein LOC779912 [Xenopus tropicalis]AAI21858.1 hypothetical protein MGC145244 [Xenopus tropicalis]|eukprot:NP_001072457.1 uncharacterized protein LOC779912 [Xenopus tropicalis]
MPKCIVRSCPHKSGKKIQYPDVILHVFPKNFERIKRWLQQTGQEFKDLDRYAQCILEEKKNDNYRMCSDHFAPECYTFRGSTKALREDAVPTIFPDANGRPMIKESNFNRSYAKKIRLQAQLAETQASNSQNTEVPAAFMSHADSLASYLAGKRRDASTQTEGHGVATDQAAEFPEIVMPTNAEPDLCNSNMIKELMGEKIPLHDKQTSCLGRNCSVGGSTVTSVQSQKRKESSLPLETTHEVSVTIEDISEEDIVQERKFLVFESCLDTLFYKLTCGAGVGCTSPVGSFRKHVDGSFLSVTGCCVNGHQFQLWQSQPYLEQVAAGNLLLSAAILFSGSNFKQVHEMNNLLGLQQISRTDYLKHQKEFLFGTIDHHWLLEQQRVKEEIGKKALCIVADEMYSSSKHTAKHCSYAMIDQATQKVVDFKACPLARIRSITVRRAFQNCLDRILDDKFDVHAVATDCHPGIERLMREKYVAINHQYKVCSYSKELKKRLILASKKKMSEKIELWINPIINHFWWSIKTCGGDGNMLRERWRSLLYHLTNQHNWVDLDLYSSCSHKPLTWKERKATPWLKKKEPSL